MNNKVPQEINNIVGDNLKALAQLFPSAVKDGLLDVEALKEELGQFEEVDAEKYELSWSGKQNAKKLAQQDVYNRTLKYVPSDSKNADTTENLYIEGDNLEVLKLLRQNYYGSIKMIYIDPPYNTGNDFVYNDKFSMDKKASDIAEGTSDEDGNPLQKNQHSSNRYHANWLNMMYPRLKIAKDLLADDGVIFISIGQEEVVSISKLIDEIFSEDNRLSIITRVTKTASNNGTFFAPTTDFVICVAKNNNALDKFYDLVNEALFKKVENRGERKGEKYRDDVALYQAALNDLRPNQKYFIECPDGSRVIPPCSVLDETMREGDGRWRWSKEKYLQSQHLLVFKPTNRSPLVDENGNQAKYNIYTKSYLSDRQETGTLPREFWTDFINRKGADLLKKHNIPFDFSKPIELIEYIMKIIRTNSDDIILDFFSGSATTAHAVMKLNAEDGGNRKFIMVQYPEITDEKSEAAKAGYKNICEIGKERIRRAGDKIKAEIETSNAQLKIGEEPKQVPDIGFKVFRTDDTNIKWNIVENIEELSLENMTHTPDLMDFVLTYKDIDVVYEIMLRQKDVALSDTLETLADIGKRTYLYASSYLICLETEITEELIEKLAALAPLPIKFVFRDSAFKDDIDLKDYSFRRLKSLIDRNNGDKKQTYTVEFI